jgi:hypothetical protein
MKASIQSFQPSLRTKALAVQFATAIALASVLAIPVASAQGEQVVTTPSGVAYVSGGVGTESQDHLRAMERDFNLKLVFALNTGNYLADISVTILDSANNVRLTTTAQGPWLLAKLPPGNYQINVANGGAIESRKVAVGDSALKTVDFRWPPSPADALGTG